MGDQNKKGECEFLMTNKEGPDYLGFAIHFICGAILGVCLGMWVFIKSPWADSVSLAPMFIYLVAGGLLFGTLAGMQKEEMWESFPQAFDDYWFWVLKLWIGVTVIILLAIFLIGAMGGKN